MGYILSLVVVCFAVFTAGQSADLSIGVSYTSLQGDLVSYQLFLGDKRSIELSTNDVTLSCCSGLFSLTSSSFRNSSFYQRMDNSTYRIQTVFVNIGGFMNFLVCSNASYSLTAGLDYSGFGLVRSVNETFNVGLSPGSAVQIASGSSSGFIACLTSSAINSNSGLPRLYWPNGTQLELFSGLEAADNGTETYGIYSTAGLQLRFRDFKEEGEYRCATLDGDSRPINITFVIFSGETGPCNLTSCPLYSQCNDTATDNLCECQFQFLEYSSARCQCPEGSALNATAPPFNCQDIDECVAVPPVCSHLGHNATCTNTIGNYLCACLPNYTIANEVCVHSCDIMNCSQHSNRFCQWNGNQTFSCECINGYFPIVNSSACYLATTLSSSLIPTVYSSLGSMSSSLIPTVYSSLIPTYSSSSMAPATYSSSLMPTTLSTIPVTSTTASTGAPVSSATQLQNQKAAQLQEYQQAMTSPTEEETNEILADISSSLLDTSANPSNFAFAAVLINHLTQLMDSITKEQLVELLDILSSVANLSVLTEIDNSIDTSLNVGVVVSSIVEAVENIAQLLGQLFSSSQNGTVIESDNIRLEVQSLELDEGTVVFGENTTAEFSLGALLASSFVCKVGQNCSGNISDCETVGVSIQIKNLNSFLTGPPPFVPWFCSDHESDLRQLGNSDFFSFSLVSVLCNINTSDLAEPIIFNFRLQDTSLTDPTCVSLAPGPQGLTPDSSTCTQIAASSSEDTISCSCNHLTSFSILMSPDTEYEYSFEMELFTYVGLSVSILSLTMALLIFTFIRFKVSVAIFFVHYNLMLTVLLSEVIFLVGIDRSEIPALCLIIAALLHYILLVSFCWMFFEIFNLLILIFRPRVNQKWIVHLYWPLAYGLPLIVVGITLGISHCNYGNYRGVSYPTPMSTNCWLPRRGGAYWAFIGPSLFIILINTLMLAVLIVKLVHIKWMGKSYRASSLHKSTSHTLAEGFISAIRATVLLLPIMGFTWIFGVFAINSGETLSLVFQWLFLLFNCLQGFFIFLFYCVLKTEVRDAVLLLLLRKVCRREIRLAEGQSLFSSFAATRKQSVGTEKGTMKRNPTAPESPFKSYKEDISLVPVSPVKKHPTQSVGARTHSFPVAYANPVNSSATDL